MNKRNFLVFIIGINLILTAATAHAARHRITQTSEEAPVSLGLTHLLPSVDIIPGGMIVLGTSMGVGVLDLFDLSTNLWLDFQSVFNISAKINLLRNQDYGLAVFATYTSQSVTTA